MANFCGGFDFPPQGSSQRAAGGGQPASGRQWGRQGQGLGGSTAAQRQQGPPVGSAGGGEGGLATRTLIKDLTPHRPNTVSIKLVVFFKLQSCVVCVPFLPDSW